MHEFIKNRLKDIGRTQKELADYIGIQPPHLSAIFKGIRKIQSNEILPISKFLDIDIATLTKMIAGEKLELSPPSSTCTIYKVGYVQAGKWNEACQLPEDEWESIPYPINDKYSPKSIFALGVKGYSMDKVFPPDITTLICVKLEEWISINKTDNIDGKYIIAYCSTPDGKCEATVKKYIKANKNTILLEPETSKPDEFKTIVLNIDNIDDNENEYEISAVVIGDMRIY